MKQTKHRNRRSFRSWAMPEQRKQTQDSEKLDLRRLMALSQGRERHVPNIGKNNGPLKHSVPAQNISRQFTLRRHSILKDPCQRRNILTETCRSVSGLRYQNDGTGIVRLGF